jgi:serine/threonine protein kinase
LVGWLVGGCTKKNEKEKETARLPGLEKTRERGENVFPFPSISFLSFFRRFPSLHGLPRNTNTKRLQNERKAQKTKQDPTHVYLALEFVRGGEFFRHLRARGRLPEAAARAYAAEVVVALEAMHDRGIVYRDLKVKKRVSRFSRKKNNVCINKPC